VSVSVSECEWWWRYDFFSCGWDFLRTQIHLLTWIHTLSHTQQVTSFRPHWFAPLERHIHTHTHNPTCSYVGGKYSSFFLTASSHREACTRW
jgi:hypothetical protein